MTSENYLFIPLPLENTSVIFIDLEFLYRQPADILNKFKQHINDLHMRCFNVEMVRYSGTLCLATAYLIQSQSLEFILIESPELIASMAVIYVEDTKAQLWSVCSSINGQARQLSRVIIRECQKVLDNISLFVDYFNPYWERALGLYTSMGFGNPQNVLYQDTQRLYLEWIKDIAFDKTETQNAAKRIKVEYCNSIGYNVAVLTLKRRQLEILKNFTAQYREYGGGIGTKIKNGGGQAASYTATTISNLHVGNFIVRPEAYVSVRFNTFYSFHTHPDVYVNMIKSILNPPSINDLILMLYNFPQGVVKHFVVEQNGIWTIQVDPKTMKLIADNNCSVPNITNVLRRRLKVLENNWGQILSELDENDELLKNTLINNYLADLNNITWMSLGIGIQENIPIMLVNYYSWEYLFKENSFKDWTYYIPCGPIVLNDLNNIDFNFDYNELKPILDAIDYVGKLDVGRCVGTEEDLMNTFEEFKEVRDCQDRWDGKELISFMKMYNPAEIAEKIYNGDI